MNLRVKLLLLGAAAATSVMAFSPDSGAGPRPARRLLGFQTLYGVQGPFLGAANALHGLVGDDLPWSVTEARGSLDSSGHLSLKIDGLVRAEDPLVPSELQGLNAEPRFRVVLACLSEDEYGDLVPCKVATEGFEATTRGDCSIETQIAVPNPCVAPVVFVTGMDDGAWFAVSGLEHGD
jgi:hypothetical protein